MARGEWCDWSYFSTDNCPHLTHERNNVEPLFLGHQLPQYKHRKVRCPSCGKRLSVVLYTQADREVVWVTRPHKVRKHKPRRKKDKGK